jgi:DNA-binding NarL/FixJ family response regulator
MAIDADGRPDTSSRVAELERRLWRIAHEVEQSGVAAGFERIPDQGALPGLRELSGRQWEVLTRLLRGERAPSIATDLHLSQSTVRNHLSDIFRKLGVHSQQELLQLLRTAPRVQARAAAGMEGRTTSQ